MPQPKLPDDLFSSEHPADLFASEAPTAQPAPDTSFLDSFPDSIKSGSRFAMEPLLNKIRMNDTQVYDPHAAANYYDVPNSTDWRIPFTGGATWKGLGAGMLEGAGDVVGGLSSPLNLATMAASGGAVRGVPGASMATKALSAPVMAHGAYQAATGETPSEQLFGVAEMAGGGAGMMHMPSARQPKLKSISPEIPAQIADATAQHLADMHLKSSEIVKSTEPLLQPHEIEAAKARYYELVDKGTNGSLTQPELMEGQALDKKLRAVHFGESGAPKPETGMTPNEGVTPPPATIDPQAQAMRDQTQAITPEVMPVDLWEQGRAAREAKEAAQGGPDDLTAWAAHEHYRDAQMQAGNPDPGPYKQGPRGVIDIGPEATALEAQIPPEMQQSFSVDNLQGLERSPNASGESAASAEALSRQSGMKDRGEQHVVYDRAGNKRVLVGPESVDYNPAKGETYGVETPRGFVQLTDNGGKVPGKVIKPQRKEYPGYKGTEGQPIDIANEVAPLRQRLDAATQPKQASEFGPQNVSEVTKVIEDANNLPEGPEKQNLIRRALGANKAILTSWDLSAPGRQGKSFILNKSWWNSLDDMVKAWGSKDAAHMIDQSIIDHPSGYFKPTTDANGVAGPSFAHKVGLDIAPHEEMFNTTIGKAVGKLGLVERSSRAHTAFLNKLRSDQFATFMEDAKKAGADPEKNLMLPKAYAKFINDATGRGSLNFSKWKLEKNANVLNDVFFAPRNMSGQIRTWNAVLNPYKYYQADPQLRKQALKSLFAIAGTGLAVGELAKLAGAQVSDDPTSADYRKIKIGNTRIDPFGGYQQFPVAAMKLLTGQSTSTTSGKTTDLTGHRYGQQSRGSVAERFFTNRLAPLPSFVWAWMFNHEFDGKPFEVKRALYERTMPIAMKDIYDIAQEDPKLAATLAIPTTLGLTGTQTYTGR